jgi:PAS domain S-box-containing protein
MRRNSDSDLVELEGSFQDGDALFRAVFEQSAVAMAISDSDGRLVVVNSAFARLVGYEAGELPGRSFLNITHPQDIRRSAMVLASASSAENGSVRYETRYVRKDQEVLPVRVTLSRICDADRQLEGYSAVVEPSSS